MPITAVLFESALGYSLFNIEETEEIAISEASVQQSIADLSRFGKICKFKAFVPFRNAQAALENANAVSEGILHDDLQNFIETNLPKMKKKSKNYLGVSDKNLGSSIKDALDIQCDHTGVVPEIIRGVRVHFDKLVKNIKATSLGKAQLGLGHSYSRAKVKFNVHRSDNMIIQAICLLDQLDKDINTFSMRCREWYSYHFPELVKIVNDNYLFAKLCKMIKHRNSLNDESLEDLEKITMDSAKAQQILNASRTSMGMDISEIDMININAFSERVIALADYRSSLWEYLQKKMKAVAPNLASLIGEQVGARLISHAGSLTSLAKYPASTVQILGAEKALFRALKTKGNTPKYGLIFHSTFIGRAGAKNKGRISRYLANKCSMASRIDCFSDEMTSKFGEEMREQVEERLKFYETGDAPRKNIDVMQAVIKQLDSTKPAAASGADDEGAKKKKKKKRSSDDDDENDGSKKKKAKKTPEKEKKKKKKKSSKKE